MNSKPIRTSNSRDLGNRVQAQLGMLVVMFLLGISINLIGLPSDLSGTAKTASTIFFVLHGLLAIGLIINAGLVIRLALKTNSSLVKRAQLGAGVIFLTFIAGIVTSETSSSWWSFAMAAGFAASLPIYGTLLLRARTKQAN
jgi:hypothetical protein